MVMTAPFRSCSCSLHLRMFIFEVTTFVCVIQWLLCWCHFEADSLLWVFCLLLKKQPGTYYSYLTIKNSRLIWIGWFILSQGPGIKGKVVHAPKHHTMTLYRKCGNKDPYILYFVIRWRSMIKARGPGMPNNFFTKVIYFLKVVHRSWQQLLTRYFQIRTVVSDYYPKNENGRAKGYMSLEYSIPKHAKEAVTLVNNYKLYWQHTFIVNLFTDFKKWVKLCKHLTQKIISL
jgi:hypothetical protein